MAPWSSSNHPAPGVVVEPRVEDAERALRVIADASDATRVLREPSPSMRVHDWLIICTGSADARDWTSRMN